MRQILYRNSFRTFGDQGKIRFVMFLIVVRHFPKGKTFHHKINPAHLKAVGK